MKKFLCFISLFLMAFNVKAIEVTIDNTTKATVVMAFSYYDKDKKDWVVEGWYNVESNQKGIVNLNTDNDIFYLYSEFSNGKKLEAGRGSLDLMIKDRSFYYLQKQKPSDMNKKATFLRAKANQGKSLIKIN